MALRPFFDEYPLDPARAVRWESKADHGRFRYVVTAVHASDGSGNPFGVFLVQAHEQSALTPPMQKDNSPRAPVIGPNLRPKFEERPSQIMIEAFRGENSDRVQIAHAPFQDADSFQPGFRTSLLAHMRQFESDAFPGAAQSALSIGEVQIADVRKTESRARNYLMACLKNQS